MDGLDSGPPCWVHFLGAVREEPGDDYRQRPYEIAHGAEGWAGRAGTAGRAVAMSAVRADAARGIHGPQSPATTLSLPRRAAESRRGLVYFLRGLAAGSGRSPGSARSHRR